MQPDNIKFFFLKKLDITDKKWYYKFIHKFPYFFATHNKDKNYNLGKGCETMKSVGFIYTTEQSFKEIVKANELSPDKCYLIRIHTCVHSSVTVTPFIEKILSQLPNSKIIGTSTSGVIFGGKIETDCCMVSITDFNNASVETFMTDLNTADGANFTGSELADTVASQLVDSSSKFMLAFFARPYIKIEEFVDHINDIAKDICLIGGVANSPESPLANPYKHYSFVFTEKGVSCSSAAFAVINPHAEMSVYSDIIYVTEPVGEIHTITDADGMIIRSVDGVNTVDWYQNMLGVKLNDSNMEDTTVAFPLVRVDHNNIPWAISYSSQTSGNVTFEDEPDPLMYVLNEVKVGDRIRISYSSLQKTIEICENVCENINERPAEVLFGYSCVSRQKMFSNCAKWELLPFEKTNLCGALVVGEIGNMNHHNSYCNYSFAIASLSESNSHIKINVNALEDHADALLNSQQSIINYLLDKSANNTNINRARQQLEIKSSLFTDEDTGLGNITKLLYDRNLGKFDKICMITIRNESLLKAFLSESKFLIYFNRYHKSIMNYIDDDRYRCYIYKKNELIVTASPDISDDEFIQKMTDLQSHITDFKFSAYFPVSEFSLVMHEEDMIQKAELTLVRMRTKKFCFLMYTPEMGLEQFNAQKMKMISILNDAIINNRVVPFFQGIHDNHSNDIRMYESLMRIEDADGNIYTPYQFMDIAKEYGYYNDISYIMINKVLELFREREEKVTINMNMSDVYNYKIVHSILKGLKASPHPENFVFELTETEDIEDYQIIFEFVDKIHQAGGSIAIDDFGSGFSNIVKVFKIKSDYIKIDGEIIRNIGSDIYALEFLELISTWAKTHSKEIIAEFVENSEIQNIIEDNHIRFSQGYLYSKPTRLFG